MPFILNGPACHFKIWSQSRICSFRYSCGVRFMVLVRGPAACRRKVLLFWCCSTLRIRSLACVRQSTECVKLATCSNNYTLRTGTTKNTSFLLVVLVLRCFVSFTQLSFKSRRQSMRVAVLKSAQTGLNLLYPKTFVASCLMTVGHSERGCGSEVQYGK